MQYKLIKGSKNDTNDVIGTVLSNRGIDNPIEYLNLTEDCVCNWEDLDNIDEAVKEFDYHFCNRHEMAILVDSDPDGYSSASMMYSYIKLMDEAYPVHYMLHQKNKAHGLNDKDFELPENTKLLIIPDAGTNDCEACNDLIAHGIAEMTAQYPVRFSAQGSGYFPRCGIQQGTFPVFPKSSSAACSHERTTLQ